MKQIALSRLPELLEAMAARGSLYCPLEDGTGASRFARWEQKYAALERRCQRLEEGLPAARLHRGRLGPACANAVKRGCFAVLRTVFGWGRTLAGRLGIKERLKKSRLFRRLYLRGTIDKLRK